MIMHTSSLFPPIDDAFKQHVKRVDYQVATWVPSHEAKPVIWQPDGDGRLLRHNKLVPVMFENDAAPMEVRDLTHLYCIDNNCFQNLLCHCLKAGLSCTEFFSCNADQCANVYNDFALTDSSDDEHD